MGGWNSGRPAIHAVVEDGFTLDINQLIRRRCFRPGQHTIGTVTWTNTRTGEQTASIRYEAAMASAEASWVHLRYAVDDVPQDYRVRLEVTSCHYGGCRWWWICPVSGRRVGKLCLPPGAKMFASRKAYRLTYRSQRMAPGDRARTRCKRLSHRLGGMSNRLQDLPPPRPKGMHGRTYERLEADLRAARDAQDNAFNAGATAFLARIEKAKIGHRK